MTNRKRAIVLFCMLNFGTLAISLIYAFLFLISAREGYHWFDCRFHALFGLYCPGCGGSRSVLALLRLDLFRSFLYYPPIPLTVGLMIDYDIRLIYDAVFDTDRARTSFRKGAVLLIPTAILVTFAIRLVLQLVFRIDPFTLF